MVPAPERLLAMLLRLSGGLRGAGVGVSMVEVLDAAEVLRHVDLLDRALLRSCLQATLVKRPEDVEVFQLLFDQCFPLTRPATSTPGGPASPFDQASGAVAGGLATPAPGGDAGGPGGAGDNGPVAGATRLSTDLLEALLAALRAGDEDALRALAAHAVDAYSGLGQITGGERYFLYRVLRAVDLSNLLVAAMQRARAEAGDADALALRHARDHLAGEVDRFRRLLAHEVRRRLHHPDAGLPGVGLVGPRRIEDLDVLQASTVELREMRHAVRPLARKLASRVGERRRRHPRGRLDVRRTVRRSLDKGGVPLDPAFRRKRPSKPKVVVLCDISGSVAEFAHFTLMLLHALQTELAGLRSFVFVDGVAEVTHLLDASEAALDPRLLVTLPGVVARDGHSDYQEAFERFLARHAGAVGPATTVIVAGDGRTNYRSPGLEPFGELCRRARRVYWFNPEPRGEWGTDDSAIPSYRGVCDAIHEVRTLRQLADAVDTIL